MVKVSTCTLYLYQTILTIDNTKTEIIYLFTSLHLYLLVTNCRRKYVNTNKMWDQLAKYGALV